MSIDQHLIHLCDIERPTETTDPLGNRQLTWPDSPQQSDCHCRLVVKEEQIMTDNRAELARVTRYRMLLPPATDVQEGDRISNVRDENGDEIAGTWTVLAILPRRARVERHRTVELRRVS